MLKAFVYNVRSKMNDLSTLYLTSWILAEDSVRAETVVRRLNAEKAKDDYPDLKIRDVVVDLVEMNIHDFLLCSDIVDFSFNKKLDWAEDMILDGISDGKKLRDSLSMVLCAVSEDAYNRGRMAEKAKNGN